MQRALILQSGQSITAKDIIFEAVSGQELNTSVSQTEVSSSTESSKSAVEGFDLRSQEQRHILDMLEKYQGSRRLTAKELGISERTLRYKIAKFREQWVEIPEKLGKKSA